jgi:hypothetical protein
VAQDDSKRAVYLAPHARLPCFKLGVSAVPFKRLRQLREPFVVEATWLLWCTQARADEIEEEFKIRFERRHYVRELRDGCSEWFALDCFDQMLAALSEKARKAAPRRLSDEIAEAEAAAIKAPRRYGPLAAPLTSGVLAARAQSPFALREGQPELQAVRARYERGHCSSRQDVLWHGESRPRSIQLGDVWRGVVRPLDAPVRVVGTFEEKTIFPLLREIEYCDFVYYELVPTDGTIHAVAAKNFFRFASIVSRLEPIPIGQPFEVKQPEPPDTGAGLLRAARWKAQLETTRKTTESLIEALQFLANEVFAALQMPGEGDALWRSFMSAMDNLRGELVYAAVCGDDDANEPYASAIAVFMRHVHRKAPNPSLLDAVAERVSKAFQLANPPDTAVDLNFAPANDGQVEDRALRAFLSTSPAEWSALIGRWLPDLPSRDSHSVMIRFAQGARVIGRFVDTVRRGTNAPLYAAAEWVTTDGIRLTKELLELESAEP